MEVGGLLGQTERAPHSSLVFLLKQIVHNQGFFNHSEAVLVVLQPKRGQNDNHYLLLSFGFFFKNAHFIAQIFGICLRQGKLRTIKLDLKKIYYLIISV
jgi:hypothetical protein